MGNIYGDSISVTGKHINLWLSKEDYEKLEGMRNEKNYSRSDMIRFLIQEYQEVEIEKDDWPMDIP